MTYPGLGKRVIHAKYLVPGLKENSRYVACLMFLTITVEDMCYEIGRAEACVD